MSDTQTEKSEMSLELAFAANAMQSRIAPVGSAQYVKTRIRIAATRLGWKYGRTRDVWYADPRVSIKPSELRKIEQVAGLKYGQEEIRSIDQLIANADALLMGNDPDFVGAFVAAFRTFASTLDRTRASRRGDE